MGDTKPKNMGEQLASNPPAERKVDSYFYCGLAAGFLLSTAGFFLTDKNPIAAHLVLSCGLGIVMWSFGARAYIEHKNWVASGSFAIAMIAFSALMYFQPPGKGDRQEQYAYIQISGMPAKTKVKLSGKTDLLSSSFGTVHEFVAMKRHIDTPYLRATFDVPIADTKETFEVNFECLPKLEFSSIIGKTEPNYWVFDAENELLFNAGDKSLGARKKPCVTASNTYNNNPIGFWITSAFAASTTTINSLLETIKIDDVRERRWARSTLAAKGISMVKPSLAALLAPNSSYRTQLGVSVALSEMLEKSPNLRQTISKMTSNQALKKLVQLTGHPSRTMRTYSTGFLYQLGDPRTIGIAFAKLNKPKSPYPFNAVKVIEGTLVHSSPEEKIKVANLLKNLDLKGKTKTKKLAREVQAQAEGRKSESKYSVVVGSFRNADSARAYAKKINQLSPGLKAFAAQPYSKTGLVPVIVGDFATRSKAKQIRQRALSHKFINDAFLAKYAIRKKL